MNSPPAAFGGVLARGVAMVAAVGLCSAFAGLSLIALADDLAESSAGDPSAGSRVQVNNGSPVFGPNQGTVSRSARGDSATSASLGDVGPFDGVVRVEIVPLDYPAPKFPELGPYA